MPLIIDLDRVQQRAITMHDAFEVMRYMLEQDDGLTDAAIDAAVQQIAEPIIATIDCTQCANCCRCLPVYLTPHDAQRLSMPLGLSQGHFEEHYIERAAAQEEGEWGMFKQRPCAFLNGKVCRHYAHRPESCRIYPVFTPDFRWTLTDLIDGAGLCPIILNVLEAMHAWYEAHLAEVREFNAR